MKNILFGSLVAMSLITFTACSGAKAGTASGSDKKAEKSMKCGEGKCGADKKAMKCAAGKCGGDKKAEKAMKCSAGKCGGDKK